MQPGKRTSSEPAKDPDRASEPRDEPAPSKRQRVSLACDHCRTARGRCDGGRPSCDACLAQGRPCSYTSSRRRRGTPTGYLRAVESSLAYLLQAVPENKKHLERLLKHDAEIFTARRTESSDRLHKQWTSSRFRKDMWRLLVDGPRSTTGDESSAKDDDSASDGDDVLKTAATYPGPGSDPSPSFTSGPEIDRLQLSTPPAEPKNPDAAPRPNAQIPADWRRLVDVYFSHTHCWLPILDRDTVVAAALSFPPQGIPLDQTAEVASSHAELWAVLALASFQDAASNDAMMRSSPNPSPRSIYSVARNMMPSEEKRFELPHLRALLLHSLVLMGQGSGLAAWMLIGTALRLALHLRETGELYSCEDPPRPSPGDRAFAAALVLNTLASAYLGQPTFLSVDTRELNASVASMAAAAEDEAWVPTIGDVTPTNVNPVKTFYQFYKIAQVLGASLKTSGWRTAPSHGNPATHDLIGCLEPEFSYCNSVVLGSSTPAVPSAFVLHAFFLAALTQCAPGNRSSLLSCLREVVESCVAHFGPCGVPPVIVCLAGTALRSRHADRIDAGERAKWDRVAGHLRMVWTGRTGVRMAKPSTGSGAAASMRRPDLRGLGQRIGSPAMPSPFQPELVGLPDIQLSPPSPDTVTFDDGRGMSWTDEQTATYDPFLSDVGFTWLDGTTPYLC